MSQQSLIKKLEALLNEMSIVLIYAFSQTISQNIRFQPKRLSKV